MPAINEYFKTVGEWSDDVHHYRVITPNHEEWLEGLADLYRALRTSSQVPLPELGITGIDGFDLAALEQVLVETQVPDRDSGAKPKQLSVERSDIGELALALVGEMIHGYNYGYRSVRDRELVDSPGRGIDQLGVVEVQLDSGDHACILSLGEAKVSVDKSSPPAVVDSSHDSLRAQHRKHITEHEKSIRGVISAARQTSDREAARQLYRAGMLWRIGSDRLTLRNTSMLVRDRNHKLTDFGSFRSSPEDFNPGHIDFTILVIDTDDIEDVVDNFIALAREVAA